MLGPVRGGSWHLVGDVELDAAVEVRFEVIWRATTGERRVCAVEHQFAPAAGGGAVQFDADLPGGEVKAAAGDALVLRLTNLGGGWFLPNGDGINSNGRIPSLRLPTGQ